MSLHIQYSYPQIESLNKRTYANNANITAICQNSTVCKECKIHHTSLTPKIMKENSHCSKFIIAYYAKVSTFYHMLTFLGNFCHSGKLSVLKQQHVYLQNKHGKGYP